VVSVVIIDNGEPNVVQLTFENLYKELKDIYGSELLIKKKWFDIEGIKNKYVCFVEADCLVSEGYFKSLLDDFMKKGSPRNEAVIAPATAVNFWDNKIYGYSVGFNTHGVKPNRDKKSSSLFTVEIAYIPGSILRMSMLKTIVKKLEISSDLVHLSAYISMEFWRRSAKLQGKGYRVCIDPSVSYLTTEDYVNDIGKFNVPISEDIIELFTKESI
jgi:hypothetical protein